MLTMMEWILLGTTALLAVGAGWAFYTKAKTKKEGATLLDAFKAVVHGVDAGKSYLDEQNIKTTTLTAPIVAKAEELGVKGALDELLKKVGANE